MEEKGSQQVSAVRRGLSHAISRRKREWESLLPPSPFSSCTQQMLLSSLQMQFSVPFGTATASESEGGGGLLFSAGRVCSRHRGPVTELS